MKRILCHKYGLFFLVLFLSVVLVNGCGSSKKEAEAESGIVPTTQAATVGLDVCTNCHYVQTQQWLGGPHGNMNAINHTSQAPVDLGLKSDGFPYYGYEGLGTDPNCTTMCHDPLGDGKRLTAEFTGNVERPVIGCESCHGGGGQHYGVGPLAYPRSHIDRCTQCHGIENALSHNSLENRGRLINDTHYDNPDTTDIEGYVINTQDNEACLKCHFNAHQLDMTIPRDWSRSAHGGFISDVKDTAAAQPGATINDVVAAKVTDVEAPAWSHYDFKASNRSTCQRCHTATGAKNFLSDPAVYDPTANVFTATGNQKEMLYCWACHADSRGNLRTPGAMSFTYTNNSTADYPDAGGSNVCIACHTGRETGDSINNSAADFSNTGFINSHYLTAGGTVFAKTGYTYGDRDYSIPAADLHDKIGMGVVTGNANFDAVRNNYTNGPCVTCHFGSNDGSHTLSPLTEYTPGDVSLNPVCVNCHSTRGAGTNAETTWLGTDAIAATLQGTTHKARYQAGLEALRVQLGLKGFNFTEDYPYFANTNWTTAEDTTGKLNMGAAFNYNLLIHDPGGVAHNRRYTRRLIYDSIDHLDDGALNYSVYATLNALDPATHVYKTSAIAYLINNGPVNGGTAAERF